MRYERFCMSFILQLLLLFNFLCFGLSDLIDRCKYCSFLVESFNVGMKKTENQHFAGGNTDWEERKLGKFAKSETRLVEVMEYLCKTKNLDSTAEYSGVKDLEYKCQELAEEQEETLENWYFHKQNSDPDLYHWLCFDKLKLCCRPGHYGRECRPCPGAEKNITACFGRGKCNGDGSREGTGKCQCDAGYVGLMCSNCDANYFAAAQTANFLVCKECHKACKAGCTAEGAVGCKECRSGWKFEEEKGCLDIDECLDVTLCKGEHETCLNTEGSFECICENGYTRDHKLKVCKLDIIAPESVPWIRPDTLLRSVSFSALCILLSLVLWRRSVPLAVFAGFCISFMIYIEFWLDADAFFDSLR